MKAVGKYLVVKDAPPKANKTSGGLELTDKHEDIRYLEAEVISVGDQVQGVKCCDVVLYDRAGGHNIIQDGQVLRVILERDVVIILD